MRGRTWRVEDGILALAGLLFGASSLAWPFGWDTSVHYYVGREWLLRGALPYRDAFDHKPPGIHVLHAACIALMGEGMWPIRVAELACVVVIGLCAAAIASGARERTPGLRGASIFMTSVFYYGFFDFSNTAQAELFAATLAIVMLVAALRARVDRGVLVVAALTGCEIALKPPFVILAWLPIAVLLWRARGVRVRTAATILVGALVVPGIFIAYFASKGALRPMVDAVFHWNAAYVRKPCVRSSTDVRRVLVTAFHNFSPVATTLLVGGTTSCVIASLRQRSRFVVYALAAGAMTAALVTTVVQLKFYWYHWIVGVGPVAILAAAMVRDVGRAFTRWRGAATLAVPIVVACAFVATGMQFRCWRSATMGAARFALGLDDRDTFASSFVTMWAPRRYITYERVGRWIKARSEPRDTILVRGVAAEIYVVSGLHAPRRFFWTSVFWLRSKEFDYDGWVAEDRAAIERHEARFIVTPANATGIDGVKWLEAHGYESKERIGDQVVLERLPEQGRMTVSGR